MTQLTERTSFIPRSRPTRVQGTQQQPADRSAVDHLVEDLPGDDLALPVRVSGDHNLLRLAEQLPNRAGLLADLLPGPEFPSGRDDRKMIQAPFFEHRIVLLGLGLGIKLPDATSHRSVADLEPAVTVLDALARADDSVDVLTLGQFLAEKTFTNHCSGRFHAIAAFRQTLSALTSTAS